MAEHWAKLHEAMSFGEDMDADAKALRDKFVAEFLKDRNAYLAAIRCQFIGTFAIQYAQSLMAEPYVQQQIALFSEPDPDDSKQAAADFLANAQRLRQIRDNPASKPLEIKAAIAELNAMRGFNKPADGSEDGEQALIDALRDFAAKAPS